MQEQYELMRSILLVVISGVGVSTLLYIGVDLLRTKDFQELVLRMMAIAAGVIAVGTSIFTGSSIPDILAASLLRANPLSLPVLFFGYLLPSIVGIGMGVYLTRVFFEQSDRSFRILCFVNSLVVVWTLSAFSSIGVSDDPHALAHELARASLPISEYLSENGYSEDFLIRHEGATVAELQLEYDPRSRSSNELTEEELRFRQELADRLQSYEREINRLAGKLHGRVWDRKLQALLPNLVFVFSAFIYIVVFFRRGQKVERSYNGSQDGPRNRADQPHS